MLNPKKMFGKINKDLLPMKAHYFLYNAGTAPVVPFLSTYTRQLGFSPRIVGLVYTILPITGMIAKPLVGSIADLLKCRKQVFLIGMLLTAAAFLGIFYSPHISDNVIMKQVHFACLGEAVFDTSPSGTKIDDGVIEKLGNDSVLTPCELDCPMEEKFWTVVETHWGLNLSSPHPENLVFTAMVNKSKTETFLDVAFFVIPQVVFKGASHVPICPNCGPDCHIAMKCVAKCEDPVIDNLVTRKSFTDEEAYNRYEFWVFLVLMILGWVGQAIIVSVGDAVCFEMLGDKPNRYGYQRLFGSLGWGIFSVVAGFMVDALSEEGSDQKNYLSAFYMAAAFLVVDFLICLVTVKYKQTTHSNAFFKDVGSLFLNIRVVIFLICCILVGMCTGLLWQFMFFLIEDLAKQYHDSQKWVKTLEGLIMGVQTLAGEMPFFFLSGKILKKIGHENSISLVFAVIGVRYILYSIIPDPWWFLPVELLNGVTFGLFFACMASYAKIVAPPGTEATMQGLVGAIFEGIGVSAGSYVGSVIYDTYGGVLTFRIFGIGALIACLLHVLVQMLLGSSDKSEYGYFPPTVTYGSREEDQQELTPGPNQYEGSIFT